MVPDAEASWANSEPMALVEMASAFFFLLVFCGDACTCAMLCTTSEKMALMASGVWGSSTQKSLCLI